MHMPIQCQMHYAKVTLKHQFIMLAVAYNDALKKIMSTKRGVPIQTPCSPPPRICPCIGCIIEHYCSIFR